MSLLRALGRSAGTSVRVARGMTTGGLRAGRFVGRGMATARHRGGAGESGMLRLLDLHAASCAGDALVTLGLAGTIFFSVPAGEARGRVALYLLITMLPFVLLAPVVGPVLDRFRHGRRYALAVTMLGRAFLAYLMSEHLTGFALYPAAFGSLVLSRAYGVARSAAVPRLLPEGLGLSEAGARASLYGTFAGLLVLPIGLLANVIGPEWPLRVSMIAFIYGMVTALRLPPRADSDPPEAVPRPLQAAGHKGAKVLSGRLVISTLVGASTLRALYGFLTLYMAFAIKEHNLPVKFIAWTLSDQIATVTVVAALGVGTFAATAIGTRMRIHRPALLQAGGIVLTALLAVIAAVQDTLPSVALVCLVAAAGTGLAKLANDAVIQERIDENVRASAFAHSETLLMTSWVLGGAVGLIPFGGRWGLVVGAGFMVLGAAKAVVSATKLRKERLTGTPASTESGNAAETTATSATTASTAASTTARFGATTEVRPPAPPPPPSDGREGPTRQMPARPPFSGGSPPPAPAGGTVPGTAAGPVKQRRFGWRKRRNAEASSEPAKEYPATRQVPVVAPVSPAPDDRPMAPPGYTLYRPSGVDPTRRLAEESDDEERGR